MSYIRSEGTLMGANMKKGGKVILQIEVTQDLSSREDYYHLRKMIERTVRFSLENQVVDYHVEMNRQTNQPMKQYRVDENGVVSEVRPEGKQMELELQGVAKHLIPTKMENKEVKKEIIEDFIVEGLAPSFPDLPYDFQQYTKRIRKGETYIKMANELKLSTGRIAEIFEAYHERIAPLAVKWDEWRQEKEGSDHLETREEKEPAPFDEKNREEERSEEDGVA